MLFLDGRRTAALSGGEARPPAHGCLLKYQASKYILTLLYLHKYLTAEDCENRTLQGSKADKLGREEQPGLGLKLKSRGASWVIR